MIAITMGEPAGIGAELVAKLHRETPLEDCVLIGDKNLITNTFKHQDCALNNIQIDHIPLQTDAQVGILDVKNATYVLDTIKYAAQGCLKGRYQAMVTTPIHKGIINDAGINFSGHTEFLAEVAGIKKVVMMLLNEHMRVALLTTHIPLKAVHEHITQSSLHETVHILHQDLLEKFHIKQPKIAICGLNPHAGEDGHLGTEEIDTIIPAIKKLKASGFDLVGPIPADSLFTPNKLKNYDAVLAMYHDQGLTPLKYAGFGKSVNITLGLPFIRTSVDHGTALDIAGKGLADPGSLYEAIQLARSCSQKKGTSA